MLDNEDAKLISELLKKSLDPIRDDIREIKTTLDTIESRLDSIEYRLTNIEAWIKRNDPIIQKLVKFMDTVEKRMWAGQFPEDIIKDFERRLTALERKIS